MNNELWQIVVLVCGLAFGSFVNAYVWRVHKQSETVPKNPKTKMTNKRKYSILVGRSICPKCEHDLSASDLIPIVSWIRLGGKCRYCKTKISPSYPIVEATTLILFGASYVFWPVAFKGVGLL